MIGSNSAGGPEVGRRFGFLHNIRRALSLRIGMLALYSEVISRQFFTMRARLSKAPPEFLPHEGHSPFPGRL